MKLFLISAILLMVPMAFAELPLTVATRLIYDYGRVLIETNEESVKYTKSIGDLNLDFDPYEKLWLKNVMKDTKNYAKISFVAEVMRQADGSKYPTYDCVGESEESLRRFLLDYAGRPTCEGATRLRNLTAEEIDQMEKFKHTPEGKFGFKVLHDQGNLTSQSAGYTNLAIIRRKNAMDVRAEIVTYYTGRPSASTQRISVFRYQDKSFVIDDPSGEKINCMETDVKDLLVINCDGRIQARKLKNDDAL